MVQVASSRTAAVASHIGGFDFLAVEDLDKSAELKGSFSS